MKNIAGLSRAELLKIPPEKLGELVRQAEEAYLHACRTDINTFCEAVLINPATGKGVKQSSIHIEWHKLADENNNVVIMGHPESGKMLCLDTKILTTTGYKLLRDIELHDFVLGSDGKPCMVTGLSPIDSTRDQYRLTFCDGTTEDACGEHLWKAATFDDVVRHNDCKVRTTAEMLGTLYRRNYLRLGKRRSNWFLPINEPINYPKLQSECVDFYTEGYLYSEVYKDVAFPEEWIYASITEKKDFLKSLTANQGTSTYRYNTKNEVLADRLARLVRSLGFWASAHLRGDTWYISWAPKKYKKIKKIEQIKNKPMRCISVDSYDHTYLIGDGYTVTHNTQQLIIARSLFLLGNNPSATIAIAGRALTQAKKSLKTIAEYIEHSDMLHRIFPALVPGDNWAAESITIKRPPGIRDPSIQAVGVDGSIHGARISYMFLDDVLNKTNTATETQRKSISEKINSEFYTRVTRNGKILCVSNAWHPQDLIHKQFDMPGWTCRKYPVAIDGESTWPEQWPNERIEKQKGMMHPLDFAQQYLLKVRDDASSRFKEDYFNRCKQGGDGLQTMYSISECMMQDREWVEKQDPTHMNPLSGFRADIKWMQDRGFNVITGVDLAVQKHSSADYTVFFTVLVYPVYRCPNTGTILGGERQILNIDSGRWDGPEIVAKCEDIHRRYPGPLVIENNASQGYILHFSNQALPILPYNTGARKADPVYGIASLSSELEKGLWIIPNDDGEVHPEIAKWVEGCMLYDPNAHTSDHVMANFFVREGIQLYGFGDRSEELFGTDLGSGVNVRVIG